MIFFTQKWVYTKCSVQNETQTQFIKLSRYCRFHFFDCKRNRFTGSESSSLFWQAPSKSWIWAVGRKARTFGSSKEGTAWSDDGSTKESSCNFPRQEPYDGGTKNQNDGDSQANAQQNHAHSDPWTKEETPRNVPETSSRDAKQKESAKSQALIGIFDKASIGSRENFPFLTRT